MDGDALVQATKLFSDSKHILLKNVSAIGIGTVCNWPIQVNQFDLFTFLHFCWMVNNWNVMLVLAHQTLISPRMQNGIGLLLWYSLSKSWMGRKQIIQTRILMDLDLIYARFYGLQSLSMASFYPLLLLFFHNPHELVLLGPYWITCAVQHVRLFQRTSSFHSQGWSNSKQPLWCRMGEKTWGNHFVDAYANP